MPDMLNVQIVPEASAAPKMHTAQSSSSPSSESSENSFKSILAKELPKEKPEQIAPAKSQNQAKQSTAAENSDSAGVTHNSENAEETALTEITEDDGSGAELSTDEPQSWIAAEGPDFVDLTEEISEIEEALHIINMLSNGSLNALGINKQAESTPDLSQTIDRANQATLNTAEVSLNFGNTASTAESDSQTAIAAAQANFIKNLAATQAESAKPLTPQQEALLQRIQNLIENGDTGTVTIQKAALSDESASLRQQLALLNVVQIQEADGSEISLSRILANGTGFTELEDGIFGQTLHGRQQQLTGLRHDTTHLFLDAKAQAQNNADDGAGLENKQQGGETSQQSTGFNQPSLTTAQGDTGSTFTLPSSLSTDPTATQTVDSTKTTLLPSGVMVHDHEVIQQMVERFQINRRSAMDSKIQMKLHPAELGEMQIDLTVKEGSIRANVVAQSQHVQEILERNLTKLKTVLEQQGFSIEDITVTTQSDMVGEFDLFDQQLPNKGEQGFASNTQGMDSLTPFVIDEMEENYLGSPTGVNVQA